MIFRFVFIFFFSFYSLILIAAPTDSCDKQKIERSLAILGLDPLIKTNVELLNALDYKYGLTIRDHFLEQHPFIGKKPNGMIDSNTVEWARDAIWQDTNKTVKYLPIMMKLTDEIKKQYLLMSYYMLYFHQDRTEFVFSSDTEHLEFMVFFKNNFNSIIREKYPSIPEDLLYQRRKQFELLYLNKGRYLIGFERTPHEKPIIIISGHGKEATDGIKLEKFHVVSKDLVSRLLELHFPRDSIIYLNSCHSACTVNPLPYTKKEILYLFKSSQLDKIIENGNDTFLTLFIAELNRQVPDFKGIVRGYIGRIRQTLANDVYNKQGDLVSRVNATRVDGTDGFLLLKKEDVIVSLPEKAN